jgi:hypothetical protein
MISNDTHINPGIEKLVSRCLFAVIYHPEIF